MTDMGVETPTAVSEGSEAELEARQSGPETLAKTRTKTPVGTLPITGFAAGILSGITKLVIGHPFDTLKVRLQVSGARFNHSVVTCLRSTIRKEGIKGLYKGGTPPLFGWAVMDSVMLGSLSNYRRLLAGDEGHLTYTQHTLAGLAAGLTVSFVATPIEHVKARLQVQYDAASRVYRGPIDAITQLVRSRDLYRGLTATMAQRSWFSVFWLTYAVTTKKLDDLTTPPPSPSSPSSTPNARAPFHLSDGAKSFLAGGTAASVYWAFAFPADVIKQRIMTDNLVRPKYSGWWDCARSIKVHDGWRGYYRGFLPCFLRSFPTNASAVLVFDSTMRIMGQYGW